MPPLPVIDTVYRVTLKWQPANGITPVNVMHVVSQLGDVDELATHFDSALNVSMFDPVHQDYLFQSIDVLPLDGITATSTHSVSAVGGSATGNLSPNDAAVVSFQTLRRGPRGRGRIYLGPLGDSQSLQGKLTSSAQATLLTGWEAFEIAFNDGDHRHVVASYRHATADDVSGLRVDRVVGTQRRRQDQLR